jgi:UDP-N-acetylmuramate dehydrogenase
MDTRPTLEGFDVAFDVPAATLTTWRVGGPLAALVRVRDAEELQRLSARLDDDTPVVVVGRGSNLLVADRGFTGVAIMLVDELERVDVERPDVALAGGGAALPVLARRAAAAGRTGLEFFVGIPGSVGGAVRMNAGGHGTETVEVLITAEVLRLGRDAIARRDGAALGLRFRGSDLSRRDVVVEARFRVTPDDPAACQERIDEVVRWRREHQPGGPNAGSVFVNPQPGSAGELIDRCGLKGRRVGGAVVSDKHANFIQAEAGATAADIVALIELVRAEVRARCGVALASEVQMIGFDDVTIDVEDASSEEERA